MLNTGINGKLEVYAGTSQFYGKPGVRNKKNAVKITEIVNRRMIKWAICCRRKKLMPCFME